MTDRTSNILALGAALALVSAPATANAQTRSGDDARFYSPSVALKSGLQRAPRGEDSAIVGEIPIWTIIGGVALVTLIALAAGGGDGSSSDDSFQSNGAN